jgi:hypothetical protein
MTDPEATLFYRVFLLSMWREPTQDPGAPAVVRFRLEDPRTGERQGFATVESLMAALEEEVLAQSD